MIDLPPPRVPIYANHLRGWLADAPTCEEPGCNCKPTVIRFGCGECGSQLVAADYSESTLNLYCDTCDTILRRFVVAERPEVPDGV